MFTAPRPQAPSLLYMSAADRIAREAARLYEIGQAESIRAAILAAAASTGLVDCQWPSEGRVRQHMQALAMQALGEAGYLERVRGILTAAEQLMTGLAEMIDDATSVLVGRAAKGQVEGPTRLHIRLYTERSLQDLTQTDWRRR